MKEPITLVIIFLSYVLSILLMTLILLRLGRRTRTIAIVATFMVMILSAMWSDYLVDLRRLSLALWGIGASFLGGMAGVLMSIYLIIKIRKIKWQDIVRS